MIRRYHEAPISIFNEVQKLTDGDYALVHLFDQNQQYYQMFEDAVRKGRDVILDNSLYELKEAFDPERYVYWIKKLQPTWYIVPDSWKNSEKTIEMFFDFIHKYPDLPGKRFGVAQGTNVGSVAKTYKEIEPYCDRIGFSLDFSSQSGVPEKGVPYCLRMSLGRCFVVQTLFHIGIINEEKPHHLLGCGVPQEVLWYDKRWKWLDSIDTCNPVIHGMLGIQYDNELPGLSKKSTELMCDHINDQISEQQLELIKQNIQSMKTYCE